ncbi:YsnF/AvaK domain-containing protein [Methylobacterium oxalidis]|uniref:YsnF/AvaK domain-containing protein n=1 Tax=Methylobacterium oxalidis TaxID=944322 RepID=UPI00331649E4
MTKTITAMYDNRSDAEAAQSKLVSAGIPQSAIKLLAGTQTAQTRTTGYDHTRDEGGFWGSLKDLFMPEEDRYSYSEGLSRGGTMLSASIDDANVDTALDIMEEHGSVDMDEREASWRKEGWAGYTGSSAGATTGAAAGTSTNPSMLGAAGAAGGVPAAGQTTGTAGRTTAADLSDRRAAATTGARGTAAGDKEYIPVVEEQLKVGKRMTEHGRVRVRSYAVETPVNEQVNLREETVHVDRRPVDRPVTAADEALFAEKTIEATARGEQAVVDKQARVVEEVGIRKDATQRTETVSDTVRRTEVEVEDERGNVSRTGTTDTSGTTPRKPV